MIFLDENRSTITYEENWQSVSEPEAPVILAPGEAEPEALPRERRTPAAPRQLLLTMQLVVCMVVAVAAFALKNIGGEVYDTARAWYAEKLNETLLFDGSAGLENLLPASTDDEA